MRNLICWGMLGIVFVGGYRLLRGSHTLSGSSGDHAIVRSCPIDGCPSCCAGGECAATSTETCPACRSCCHVAASTTETVESETETQVLNTIIELQKTSPTVSTAIVIPDDPDVTLPLPATALETDPVDPVVLVPVVMPYCDDDCATPRTMPYAADDVWPATKAATDPAGWFEESESVGNDRVPACREDENLSLQYPGCPAPSLVVPSGRKNAKHASPWQHDKEPILPILPAVRDGEVPTPDLGEINGPQASGGKPGLLRHTTLKLFFGRDSESPARQPVDTLELRPGDLPADEVVPERF